MTLRERFSSFYELTEDEKKTLWEEGVFYLDSSVLLSLYRYPESAREDMFMMLEVLKDRVWVPHHVGIEYHRNRLKVIQEQKDQFEQVESDIEESIARLKKKFKELHERHPLIEPNLLFEDFENAAEDFGKHLAELEDKQPSFRDEDKIGERINALVGEKVTDDPAYSQEDVDKLVEEAERRGKNKIPPGYEDYKKKKNHSRWHYDGLDYHPIQGDLTLWKQLVAHAEQEGFKYVVFLTDDQKEDWWEEFHGETIGPRRELRQEIARDGKVEIFSMYQPKGFLIEGASRLKLDIEEDSPEQVEEASKAFFKGYRHAKQLFDLSEGSRVVSPNAPQGGRPRPVPEELVSVTERYLAKDLPRSHVEFKGGGAFLTYPYEQPDEKSVVLAFLWTDLVFEMSSTAKILAKLSRVYSETYPVQKILLIFPMPHAYVSAFAETIFDGLSDLLELGVLLELVSLTRDGQDQYLTHVY